MSGILNDAAAVAGFLSLGGTALSGCVKGFILLSQARGYGNEASFIRYMIEVEQHRLCSWAHAAGLLHVPPNTLIDPSDFVLVQNALELLQGLLTDVDRLKTDYGLNIQVTGEEIKELKHPDTMFSRLGFRQKPTFYNDAARVFQTRSSIWTRLNWVSVDIDQLQKLLSRVSYLNDRLEKFLERSERIDLARSLDILLRTVVVNTTRERDLSVFAQSIIRGEPGKAIAATAHVKRKRLQLSATEGMSPHSPSNSFPRNAQNPPTVQPRRRESWSSSASTIVSLKLKPERLHVVDHVESSRSRDLAFYHGEPVLVEWKDADLIRPKRLIDRVEGVAALLHELTDPSFHSLRCKGYLHEPALDRYGYLFELPRSITTSKSSTGNTGGMTSLPSLHTLRSVLLWSDFSPSLNSRIKMAVTLMETVLQLHTSGWLHKGIRADNVLFLSDSRTTENRPDIDSFDIFLGGYTYARYDNPSEVTEATDSQYEADLYRHTLAGIGHHKYRKTFDLFSLGCVLLELGVWSPLATLPQICEGDNITQPQKDVSGKAKAYARARTLLHSDDVVKVCKLLEARAGRAYTGVVMSCLQAESNRPRNFTAEDEDDDLMHSFALNVQEDCLGTLRGILDCI